VTDPVRTINITSPITVFPRNSKWVALVGPSLCEGIFEVGDSPSEAVAKLERRIVQVGPACAVCTGTPISADLP
jgi:hypothetical protein